MIFTGRFLIFFSLIPCLFLAAVQPALSQTSLGLAPTSYELTDQEQAAITAINNQLAEETGQPASIRNLKNEAELLDWLLRYRELDVAVITLSLLDKQPAGALIQLADAYLERDNGPPLVMVSAPGLNPELRKQWEAALSGLKHDNGTKDASGVTGLTSTGPVSGSAHQVKPQEQPDVGANFTRSEKKPLSADSKIKSSATSSTATKAAIDPAPLSEEEIKAEAAPPPFVSGDWKDVEPVRQTTPRNAGLADFIQLVVSQNQRLKGEKARLEITHAEEDKTHAIFEPDFITSLQLEDNRQRNTAEESLNRLLSSIYEERNWDYNASLQGLLPTGAHYNLGYKYRNLSNSVNKDLTGEDDENQIYLGFSLTQPLLKNAGTDATKAEIRVAEYETKASLHDYRQELMKTAREAALAYWDYYQAMEILLLREDSVRIANDILKDNRERQRTGKMSEAEVLEAMAGVANRESLVSEARYEKKRAENHIRALLAINPGTDGLPFDFKQLSLTDIPSLSRVDRIQKATTLRPDYLAAHERVKQADIKIAYAKNQRWPELDLVASYGLNGLAFTSGDAWDQITDTEYDSWAVGLELTLPLLGGLDTRSDLKKSQLEKKSQLWELKDIEVNIANEIDSAIDQMASTMMQLDYSMNIVELNQQLLKTEKAKLESGKSNSRQVLEKEDRYRIAREATLDKQIRWQAALIDLELAEGSILVNNGVEIMGREE